jgi:hypothetical protein
MRMEERSRYDRNLHLDNNDWLRVFKKRGYLLSRCISPLDGVLRVLIGVKECTALFSEFEYDIFISYCQKDNIYDCRVTEFVNNLKGELDSTFNEKISVFFDINPHDGLLETHEHPDKRK